MSYFDSIFLLEWYI